LLNTGLKVSVMLVLIAMLKARTRWCMLRKIGLIRWQWSIVVKMN